MRIALVISSLGAGGAQRVLSVLANLWVNHGHAVNIITFSDTDCTPFYPLDPRVKLNQLNQRGHQKKMLVMRLITILKRMSLLRKTIQALKSEVVVSFVDVMNIETLLATLGLGIPVIVSERTHPKYYKLPKLYQLVRRWIYPTSQQVVVQTLSVAHYFNFLKNIKVIPNPVLIPKHTKQTNADQVKTLVSVGRLDPNKGFDTLIHAFVALLKRYSQLELVIYGEGLESARLNTLVTSLKLTDKVRFPGNVTNIHEALTKADLFIFPSLYEGFPNALCEAMAVGLPVIASNCSGNIDIVQEGINGRFFPVGNTTALIQIMDELINDANQRHRLSENAREITKHFSVERVLGMWNEVLLSVKS